MKPQDACAAPQETVVPGFQNSRGFARVAVALTHSPTSAATRPYGHLMAFSLAYLPRSPLMLISPTMRYSPDWLGEYGQI